MKTEKEWGQDILNITMRIHQEHPELSKYIEELPQRVFPKGKKKLNIAFLEDYYNSLEELIGEYSKTHSIEAIRMKEKNKLLGYPLYPPSEDIYNMGKKVKDLDPSDLSKKKSRNKNPGFFNEKSFEEDMSGDDLDVPGSELDNQQESVGSEDEENNYYSIGSDNHNDLEEDNG